LTAFVDGQQIGDKFARHRQRRTVAMSAFQLSGMQRGQLRIPSRGGPRLLISLASPTQRGAPSFVFLAKGSEEVGRIINGKSASRL